MGILLYILIFLLGFSVGFLVKTWLGRRSKYGGTILVNKISGKTVYSLILDDYPEKLEFKKQILFKVDASDESLNRE